MRSDKAFPRLATALAIGALVAGCASRAPVVSTPAAAVVGESPTPHEASHESVFAAGRSILDGFDLAHSLDHWASGDRVLLGLRTTKRGQETIRYLLIELTGEEAEGPPMSFSASPKNRRKFEFSSPTMRTRLSLFDQTGAPLKSTVGRFPKGLLGYGLIDGVSHSVDHPELRGREDLTEGLSEEEFDRTMRGWLTLFSFSGSMGRKGMFRDMLQDVVARPSILALILNPSVSLGFGEEWPTRCDSREVGAIRLETVRVPLECEIAGKKAAYAWVTATRPIAPLSLCGGVLEVLVKNGDDPSSTMEVRLLAARRGGVSNLE
ncbi:MAG: hypothetical protein IT438_05505 [Phycisphaerales bacterium]|nr:hypothetical protein [Phycisphaerales bacterium]